MRPKFGNRKTEVDGITFDSLKEARRYGELKLLERAGEISGLELQPKFPLTVNGQLVCTYRGDFSYRDKAGNRVIEDVKSPATRAHPVYRIKAKLLRAVYGIDVTEV